MAVVPIARIALPELTVSRGLHGNEASILVVGVTVVDGVISSRLVVRREDLSIEDVVVVVDALVTKPRNALQKASHVAVDVVAIADRDVVTTSRLCNDDRNPAAQVLRTRRRTEARGTIRPSPRYGFRRSAIGANAPERYYDGAQR
jgi:hypothetical protein